MRRLWCVWTLWATGCGQALGKRAPDDVPLRALADKAGLVVGAAVSWEPLQQDPGYAALAARHFHVLTPENALKWAPIEHTEGARDTRRIDDIARFAARNGQSLRGHTLVWDLEIPSWVDTADAHALDAALVSHMRATLSENRGRVGVWDVVNEALADDGQRAPTVLHNALGEPHIAQAFRLARAEDPDAKLFYNDYGVLWPGPKADGLLRLVDSLQAQDVPIDGVGLQSHVHLVPEGRLDHAGIRANLKRLGERGLELHLSEVDVRVADLAGGHTGRLLAQAQAVYGLVDACLDEPACTTVTFWGISDRYSWVDRTIGPDDPLLWDDDLVPKPALFAVQDALRGKPWRGCTDSLVEGSFEAGAAGFSSTGGRASVERGGTSEGRHRLVVTDRTEAWHGPQVDASEWLAEGLDYRISAKVKVPKGAPVNATLRIEDAAGTRYVSVAAAQGTGAWQALSGVVALDLHAPVGSVHWYVEGPPPGQDIELDGVVATVACPSG